jgi:RHS repeat-associated protein
MVIFDSCVLINHLRARYYNPITGRFMSRDPEDGVHRNPKTLHKYLYVGGDPVNWSDPRGRAEEANYVFTLEKSFKAAVVFNAIGCGIGIGSSLVTGTIMEVFKEDPKGAVATAWGCLTMTVSATGVVQVGLDTIALAGCGWALYQAYNAENDYFDDLNAEKYEKADEDLKKVYAGLYGGIGGCTATIWAIAAE